MAMTDISDPDPGTSGVRALIRGLRVLTALNEMPLATVSQIVLATGVPKASAVRILGTLRSEGFVELDAGGTGYRVLPKARLLSSALAIDDPAIGAIHRVLADFSQAVKWPAEFLTPDGTMMVIQSSSREVAPITLKRFEQTRFPLLDSATGIAYLTALGARERSERIREAVDWQSEEADAVRRGVRDAIARCQKNGFAQRDYESPIEGTRVIAVDVAAGDRPVGGLALIYLRDAIWEEQVRTDLVPRTRQVAARVGEIWQTFHG